MLCLLPESPTSCPTSPAGSHPGLNIAVASGDGDMQQLLTPRVTWLRLLPAPTLEHPLGVEVVSAQAFQERHGFPPGAYPDWLAFVGAS